MALPNRNNPYSFDEFLEWRNTVDFYADDPFFQKVVKHFTGEPKSYTAYRIAWRMKMDILNVRRYPYATW